MNFKKINIGKNLFFALSLLIISITSQAACVDNVVLVHGNTGTPDDWVNTYELLINNGYQSGQIYRPSW